LDGRYLYGAPASELETEGEVVIKPTEERPGFPRYRFGLADEEIETTRTPLDEIPDTDKAGKAKFKVTLDKQPAATRPLEAQIIVRLSETGGRAVERKIVLPVAPESAMIGVKPNFNGRSLGEGEQATFDVVFVTPDGNAIARSGLRYELLRIESRYQW